MFVRGRVSYLRHSRGASSSQDFNAERERLRAEEEERAAVKIQAVWRGRCERLECMRRRCRSKPWGYFTHTLVLTYVSLIRNPMYAVSTKRMVYLLLEDPASSRLAFGISLVIIGTIALSIGIFMFETWPEAYNSSPFLWFSLEALCSVIFTVEYLCRFTVCTEGGIRRWRFLISPLNLMDVLAVLPFYVEMVMGSAGTSSTFVLRFVRVVRLARLVRVFKLGRYAAGMRLVAAAMWQSTQALSVLVFLLGMGVVLFSSAVYHLERLSCPEIEDMSILQVGEYAQECADDYNRGVSPKYGLCCTEDSAANDFPSIIAAYWWSMATMTSVGYGDIYPRTRVGKCVGFLAMLVGMVLIALPVAIVGQKFQDVYESHDLEEAKYRAATRLRSEGKVWSLVPSSDVVQQLRHLELKDPALAKSVAQLASCLESTWEQREQLGRSRRIELDRQEEFRKKATDLLDGMRVSANARVPSCAT
mmetsp:Transcript_29622/g.81491  ORF Transcript_29622/g.81491 Transcript_29622/m.81491 type:complete len:475 (-) Transcript_29622:265-1689(-)